MTSISDEAFALLLYDNYVEKWLKAFQQQEQYRLETKKWKYTAQKTGHCKYGGWNREGMATYKSFYHMVKDDCASEHAMDMEREVLTHCMAFKRRGTNGEEGASLDSSPGREEAGSALEACWDLEMDEEL